MKILITFPLTLCARCNKPNFAIGALALLGLLFSLAGPCGATDDNENTEPTLWWMFTAQTVNEVNDTIAKYNARIVDIKVDNLSPYPFTVTYVQNTGAYAKQWWWYYDIDAGTLQAKLESNNARLTSLQAHDPGNGINRYAVSMIANTGADRKVWWYYDTDAAHLQESINANNARLTAIESYYANNQTRYALILIANTGADAKSSWWYYNVSPLKIANLVASNKARILNLTYAGNGNFNVAMEACSDGCPPWWWYYGKSQSETIALAQGNGARVLTVDTYPGCDAYCFATVMISGSVASDHGSPPNKLRGFVDLHTHPLSTLGFGGKLLYGGIDAPGSLLPADPNCNKYQTAQNIEQALGHDKSTHGGYNRFNNHCGDDLRQVVIHGVQSANNGNDPAGDSEGADNFLSWPTWDDITHQKMWVDWIRRSYQNGQRVLVALAVNNKTLGDSTAGPGDWPTDDVSNADRQIEQTKNFVARHGPNSDDYFMEIAYKSADVQRIIAANKMAVILGIEVDAIGNFYKSASDAAIATEVGRLYDEGVRYIFPIHILDNAFGGTAIYDASFDWSNHREHGSWWNVTCSDPGDQIDYNLKSDLSNTDQLALAAAQAFKLHDLLDPALAGSLPDPLVGAVAVSILIGDFAGALKKPPTPPTCTFPDGSKRANVNSQGLTAAGHTALKEMMKRGMLIDVDHMSQRSMNEALCDAAKIVGNYPMFSGHATIRDNGGSERNVSVGQYEKIGQYHGMAGIGTAGLGAARWTDYAVKVVAAMGGHAGVAFGTDTDGMALGMPVDLPRLESGSTPGALYSHELGTACIINCQHDQQHAFYRDTLGAIVHVFYDNGGAGSSPHRASETWAGTPAAVVSAPTAVGNPATMFTDSMQQHIFYRDQNGALQHVFWDPKNGAKAEIWGQGTGSGTMGPAPAGDPAALFDDSSHQQHIFYRDFNGNMQHVYWDPNSGLHAEVWGTNAVGTPAAIYSNEKGFACINNCAHNQQHLFYRDTSNRIMHVYFDENAGARHGPSVWAGPGSTTNITPAAGDPAALFSNNNQQHVFYVDFHGNIQHVFWDNPSSSMRTDQKPWGANAVGTPATLFTHETGTACINNCEPDLQHIFFRNTSNQMVHAYYDETHNTMHGPEIWYGAAGSDAAAIMSTNMQQHIFFADTSGNLEHVFWDPHTSSNSGLTNEMWAGGSNTDYVPPILYGEGLPRSSQYMGTTGKTWDYNYQGVVHYGMLPDFLRSVQNIPIGADLVNNNVMWGAQWFIDSWKAAETQSAAAHSATSCPAP